MPELPEVETIKRQLNTALVGQKITNITINKPKSFVGNPTDIEGLTIQKICRKGKMLIVELTDRKPITDNRKLYLLVHLKMSGQLIYQPTSTHNRIAGGHPTKDWVNQLPSSHTRVILELNHGTLFFNDQRIFGWVKIASSESVNQITGKMPPDIIDKEMTEASFQKILSRSARPIKTIVMDSQKIGGIGNIYANDGLFLAGINPSRKANSLSNQESQKLLKALKQVINKGIKLGGATASDDKFVQVSGMGGKYQEHFLTYEREGQKCKRKSCPGTIVKTRLGGRGTYFCPICQPVNE